jgi:uncharacterized membrane protein
MADAHDCRFPGTWRQRAASRGQTIALRSGGAFTGGVVMATTVTDEGVWEALRGWGWWMTPGVGHQDVAPDDRFSRRKVPDLPRKKGPRMKHFREFVVNVLVGGLLIVVPLYLAVVLLLKAMQSLAKLVRPLARLLPDWFPAEHLLSLLLVLLLCGLIGVAVRTRTGRAMRERLEKALFERLPGYALLRSLTQRLAGETQENVWQPALVEIEEALVPAFIIEELEDGRFTVFVPSVPTPFAGAVYVLSRDRVHPLDVAFTQAVQAVSRWGSGTKDLVAAMKTEHPMPKAQG